MTYNINEFMEYEDQLRYKKIMNYLNKLPEMDSIPIMFGKTNDWFARWLMRNKYDLRELLTTYDFRDVIEK